MSHLATWMVLVGVSAGAGEAAEGAPAGGEFPYEAYVDADEAPVMSGMGAEHYPTDLLDRGTRVEVYRHDDGGWFAVRPPEGSHNWVSGKQIRMTHRPNVAEVIEDDVIAWVGSRVKKITDYTWQVRLKQGELVQVLGLKRLAPDSDGNADTWYKIAPPAGEFRWINGLYLRRRPPPSGQDAAVNLPAKKSTGASPAQPPPAGSRFVKDDEVEDGKESPGDGWRTGTRSAEAAIALMSHQQPDECGHGTDQRTIPINEANAGESPTQGFAERLQRLELDLAAMVALDVPAWRLENIERQADTLAELAASPVERGQSRMLLDRIEQFAGLQRRSTLRVSSDEPPPSAAGSASPPSVFSPGVAAPLSSGASAAAPSSAAPQYDGLGWLLPVHGQERIAPRYALTDNDGRILQYVTPTPGLNLRVYMRQQVGVFGSVAHREGLDAPHLTALRVIVLERHRY